MKLTFNNLVTVLLVIVGIFMVSRYFYYKPKFINGENAPNFRGKTIGGLDFELIDLRGKYVLIDFWGSWCVPCRQENPDMVELYQRFKQVNFVDGTGLEMVSIGIERNENHWRKAIQEDRLDWTYHLMDRTSSTDHIDGSISDLYKIRAVPTKFLIDPRGVIIAVNPSPGKVRRMLDNRRKG